MSVDKFLRLVTPDLYHGSMPSRQARPLRALLTEGLSRGASLPKIAYVLATAHHETTRFLHMEEIATGEAYEGRADLGNVEPGDGPRFKGRGLVQITGRANYARMSEVVGLDLIADPDAACLPDVACTIAWHGMVTGMFTGKRLADYIAPGRCDFVGARRIVNGTDKADLIAAYADKFLAMLKEAGVTATAKPVERSSPMKSKTVQAGSAAGVGLGYKLIDAAMAADWRTAAVVAVVLLIVAYMVRERLRAWAEGWT